MQKSSPNVTNDFCNIDNETKEEIVTSLKNIYSDLTKGSNFTCTNHHDGCPARSGNVENDTSQYLYVGNEVFSYDCHCNYGGIRKEGKFLLQTLNGEEAIPVGVMRNYVKPTVMSLKTEVGPSRGGHVCPCTRCHQVSSIGCRCKGCVVEDDYLACSTERYYQCEGLSVKISNASCCFCDRGKQTYEENAAPLEGRKPDNEQASDLISKLNSIEKKINLTNMNVGNITHDNDYFSALLNELSQLIYSIKEGDRNLINTIEALKLKLMSLEKGLKCVFKDSECFQEVYQEKHISHSALSLRDEIDLKPKTVKKNGISSILIDSQKENGPMADGPSGISRKFDAETETITEAEKPADIIRHYDVHTESISETVTPAEISHEFDVRREGISEAVTPAEISHEFDVRGEGISETGTPAEISHEFDARIEGISEAGTPAEISHEFDARREGISEAETPAEISHEFDARRESISKAKTPAEISHEFDARIKTISDAKKPADIVPHYDAKTENIRKTVTPTEISHQFDARTESVNDAETPAKIRHQFDARTGSIREAIKPADSRREFGTQTRSIRGADRKALTPSGSSHRFDAQIENGLESVTSPKDIIKSNAQIKSSNNKISERNTLQADRNAIKKTTEKDKTDTSAKQIHQINEHITNGLKTDTVRKLNTKHQKTVATTADKGTQSAEFVEIEEDAPDEKVHQIYEKMGKVFKRDKPADGIPQTDLDTSQTDTSAERKYKFDIEAESCSQDDDNYQNLTDNIQINGEKECCFKVKIKKIKILGETSNFKEYNKIKRKSVDFVESLNGSNKTKQSKKETPIPSLNKVSEEPTIFSEIAEPAEAGKLTAEKSVFSARSNGIEKHKKTGESSKKKMAKSMGRSKENGKELHSKHKFETAKKKNKHLSTNKGKYDFQKRGSLDAKQNELSMKTKANENGVKINAQKLPLFHSKKTKLTKGNSENNLTKSRIEKKGSNIESLKKGRLDSSYPKEYVHQNSKASARRKSTLNLDDVRETRQNDLLNRRIYWENKHFKRTSEPNYSDSSNRDCNQYDLINQQDYCEIEQTIPNYCDSNQENKLMNKQAFCEIKNVRETSELSGSTYCNQDSEAKECKLSPVAITFWRKVETSITSGMCHKS